MWVSVCFVFSIPYFFFFYNFMFHLAFLFFFFNSNSLIIYLSILQFTVFPLKSKQKMSSMVFKKKLHIYSTNSKLQKPTIVCSMVCCMQHVHSTTHTTVSEKQ